MKDSFLTFPIELPKMAYDFFKKLVEIFKFGVDFFEKVVLLFKTPVSRAFPANQILRFCMLSF